MGEIRKLPDEATVEVVSVGDWTKSDAATFKPVDNIEICTKNNELVKVCDQLLKKFGTQVKVLKTPSTEYTVH
jgi:hypothetical protein